MTLGRRALGVGILIAAGVRAEPKITSVYPAALARGASIEATVRGSDLAAARALVFDRPGVSAAALAVEKAAEEKQELFRIRLTVAADAAPGRREFRVLTPKGVSNAIPLHVVDEPVIDEAQAVDSLKRFPVVINGRISEPGETDAFWIDTTAGETLSFEAAPEMPGLDPSLSLYEPSGSWFDPERLNLVAANDEPLYFPGLSLDARLVHRFQRAGKYRLKVLAFSGQGGADYVYRLRISRGEAPVPDLHPPIKTDWEERRFTRRLSADRMDVLARRGGAVPKSVRAETYRAVAEGSTPVPVATAPASIEGRIAKPGETHVIRLRVEQAQDLAIEVETPEATMPRFNPVVRMMEPGGGEMATNVYTKLNNNGLYMMKMIQAKTTVSLRAPGEYTLQIRDITTDCAGKDFAYRVLVRPQVPHAGKIEITQDRFNLEAGATKPVTITVDREEGFAGYLAASVEGLPAGVTAVTALENPPERPPLPNGGKLERYTPKEQRVAILLVAAEDAPPTDLPVSVRVVVRVAGDGRLSEPIAMREIPLMVIPRKPS
jgi:hypothetical protein